MGFSRPRPADLDRRQAGNQIRNGRWGLRILHTGKWHSITAGGSANGPRMWRLCEDSVI